MKRRRRRQPSARFSIGVGRPRYLIEAALATCVVGSMLALGAVHIGVLLVFSTIALAIALWSFWSGELPGNRLPPPAWVVIALSLYCGLQALPLPMGLLALIAPDNADIWARALRPFGAESPAWASISLDPTASLVEALKGLTYAAIFCLAAAIGARRGAAWGVWLVISSATLLAVITLAHGLMDAKLVYGFYEPRFGSARLYVAPLVNANNRAGYFALGALSGLGMLVGQFRIPRWGLGIIASVCVGSLILTGSRGGLASFVLGLGILAMLVWQRRDAFQARALPARWLVSAGAAAAATLLVGAALALAALQGRLAQRLFDEDIDKLELAAAVLPMVGDHVWTGIGRGAFESVFAAYYTGEDHVIFSHAENFILQWASEWGVPVTAAALAAFAWTLRPQTIVKTGPAHALGLVAGLVALTVQNLVDLAFEVPAMAIVAVAAAGTLWGDVVGANQRESSRGPLRPVGTVVGAALAIALLVAVFLHARRSLGDDQDAVQARYEALSAGGTAVQVDELYGELRAAMKRHPAEPYFPRVGGTVAFRSGDDPMPWIQRALERSLTNGRTHFLLATVLAAKGAKSQALLELRIAAENDPELNRRVAPLALQLSRDVHDLIRVAPQGEKGSRTLSAMAALLARLEDVPIRRALLIEAIDRDPADPLPRQVRAGDLTRAIEDSSRDRECSDQLAACSKELDEHLTVLERIGRVDEAMSLRGRMLLASGQPAAAAELLVQRCRSTPCRRLALKAASSSKNRRVIDEIAQAEERAGCTGHGQCANTYASLGEAFVRLGDVDRGLSYFERAAREEPTAGRWMQVAQAARKSGDHATAVRALSRVAASRGMNKNVKQQLDQARLEVLRESLAGQ